MQEISILDKRLSIEDKKELVEELFDFALIFGDDRSELKVYTGDGFFKDDPDNEGFQLDTLRGIIEYANHIAVQSYKWKLWKKFNELV